MRLLQVCFLDVGFCGAFGLGASHHTSMAAGITLISKKGAGTFFVYRAHASAIVLGVYFSHDHIQ